MRLSPGLFLLPQQAENRLPGLPEGKKPLEFINSHDSNSKNVIVRAGPIARGGIS
jgi:hypothetical protein